MRYNVPAAPVAPQTLTPSQQIVTPRGGPGFFVVVQNQSAVPIWVSDNQQSLDSSLDATGTPSVGFQLAPYGNVDDKIYFYVCTTGLWARSQAPGGQLECSVQPNC